MGQELGISSVQLLASKLTGDTVQLIRHFKHFKTPRQQQKVELSGECAKHGCTEGVLHCGRCKKWWALDSREKDVAYERKECPFCHHTTITHNFFCKVHKNFCPDCEQDHPLPGCPHRDLRENKPIRPQHEDWLRSRIEGLRGKELLLALFSDGRGRIGMNRSKDWNLLQTIQRRLVQTYEGWESDTAIRRRKHSASAATRAGLERARAAGKKLGRPSKKTK